MRYMLITLIAAAATGCASLGSYAAAHPEVAAKAEVGVAIAQCVDQAVSKYIVDAAATISASQPAPAPAPVPPAPAPVPAPQS